MFVVNLRKMTEATKDTQIVYCAHRLRPSLVIARFILAYQLRKHIFAEALVLDQFSQAVEEVEFEVGDLLLGDAERGGDLFVRRTAHEEQLHALHFFPVALRAPVVDLLGDAVGECVFFEVAAFAAAGDAAGGAVAAGHVPGAAAAGGGGRKRQGGAAAFAAQVVGQLVGGDREQIAFERAAGVVVGQAGEEADERFLHDVFARGAAAQPAIDERQQPAFVLRDERIPRVRLAGSGFARPTACRGAAC